MLLCARPHVKEVDFVTARFIVATASGLNVHGQHLVMGDEVPQGVLSIEALRQEYEPPRRAIETAGYAREDQSLVEACARRGTSLDPLEREEYEEPVAHFVQSQAPQQCSDCGEMIADMSRHSRKQCRIARRERDMRQRNL